MKLSFILMYEYFKKIINLIVFVFILLNLLNKSTIVFYDMIEENLFSQYISDADSKTLLHSTMLHYKENLDEAGNKRNLGIATLICLFLYSVV